MNAEPMTFKIIGTIKSVFKLKNGTPRQGCLCPESRGVITIRKDVFSNPSHSLEGLQSYSHVWILFSFNQNTNKQTPAKIKPPRMNGQSVGVFASRSPMRPNSIGMTLAKLEQIDGPSLTVSGIDLIDGTPILDIKPYIPEYDDPKEFGESESVKSLPTNSDDSSSNVRFSPSAIQQISEFHSKNQEHESCLKCLEQLKSPEELKNAICNILKSDPRSNYRKTKCSDRMYFFSIDAAHITCWFDTEIGEVHVLKIKPDEKMK